MRLLTFFIALVWLWLGLVTFEFADCMSHLIITAICFLVAVILFGRVLFKRC